MPTNSHRIAALGAIAVLVPILSACGGTEHPSKSGAQARPTATLSFAMPDSDDALGAEFVTAVKRSGDLRIKRAARNYSSIDPANELALARDLQAGRVDMAYLPARAWAAAGVTPFKALLAPFVITTDAAAEKLATSPIADELLAALPGGVVGLGLVPSQTRRVLARRELLSPTDYAGLRLRIIDNEQTAADFSALGAEPVQGLLANEVGERLRGRRLDGAETAPSSVINNGYQTYVSSLSSYGIFPKFQSIVVNRAAWDKLTSTQQAALRSATQRATADAAGRIASETQSNLRQLCAASVHIAVPASTQLRALERAAQPAIAALRKDTAAEHVLDAMRAVPGSGPQPLATPLPQPCKAAARRAPAHSEVRFPNGTYVVAVTKAQFAAAGVTGPDYERDITFTQQFKDGRFVFTQRPTYPDQCADKPTRAHPACVGRYEVDGDQLTLIWGPPTPPPVPAPETVRWSYFNGELHLKPVDVQDPASLEIYRHPWRKVG
jgi:TRAP-type C4-dicarboxylate transport system substrate-binding protein